MFESLADQILALVRESAADCAPDALTALWRQIQRQSKDVMVYLESRGHAVLAARVDREYTQCKSAWQQLVAGEPKAKWLSNLGDAAEEISATLAALHRFQAHLDPAASKPDIREPLEQQQTPPRRKGRAIETDLRLQAYLRDNVAVYRRLLPQVAAGDGAARLKFRETFGPKAIADRWAAEDGEASPLQAANRWSAAIKASPVYEKLIKPLFANPPELPFGWQQVADDADGWDEILS